MLIWRLYDGIEIPVGDCVYVLLAGVPAMDSDSNPLSKPLNPPSKQYPQQIATDNPLWPIQFHFSNELLDPVVEKKHGVGQINSVRKAMSKSGCRLKVNKSVRYCSFRIIRTWCISANFRPSEMSRPNTMWRSFIFVVSTVKSWSFLIHPEHGPAHINYVLEACADITGMTSFRHAPWLLFGKSSRGRFAFRPTWSHPGRVIASMTYHGEAPTWPRADWAQPSEDTVWHVNINGLTEWDGTWYRHVRPGLLNNQLNSQWLTHQVVLYGVGHGDYIDYYKMNPPGTRTPKKLSVVESSGATLRTTSMLR